MTEKTIEEGNQFIQIGFNTAEAHLDQLAKQNQYGGVSAQTEKYFMICRQS
jgi:hypothetical protein